MRTKSGYKEKGIIDASVALFGKDGYAKTKMHHIADRAGIGIGTVYLYFNNKEKILLRIFEHVWEDLLESIVDIRKRTDIDQTQKMHALIDTVFDYFASNPQLAIVFVNEQQHIIKKNRTALFLTYYNKTLDEGEAIIDEGQKCGVLNGKVSTSFFKQFLFGGIRNTLLQWANDPKSVSLEELRRNIKIVMFSGIANPSLR